MQNHHSWRKIQYYLLSDIHITNRTSDYSAILYAYSCNYFYRTKTYLSAILTLKKYTNNIGRLSTEKKKFQIYLLGMHAIESCT